MKDKVEEILSSREWTFADLTNTNKLVRSFSEEIYTQLDAKEKLTIVWEEEIFQKTIQFGSFFQNLVMEQIQLEVASILQEQLMSANVNFGNNKNEEDETNEVSESSVGGESSPKRSANEKKSSKNKK
tara:strand:+ start:3122 stop:3505 length:384 start_codon:yes stop_codon:yes gene_type:complete